MGNLPFSRTVTLNPSDPVPSSLLDELQDKIISGSYNDQELIIGHDAFVLDSGSGTKTGDEWTLSGGSGFIQAPLRLPVGTLVKSGTFSTRTVTIGVSASVSVMTKTYGSGGAYAGISTSSINSSGAYTTTALGLASGVSTFTILSNTLYVLRMTLGGSGDLRLEGARLIINRP